jgi:hypothetical protein
VWSCATPSSYRSPDANARNRSVAKPATTAACVAIHRGLRRGDVGREERLDVQLGHHHVDGDAEHRDRAQERLPRASGHGPRLAM